MPKRALPLSLAALFLVLLLNCMTFSAKAFALGGRRFFLQPGATLSVPKGRSFLAPLGFLARGGATSLPTSKSSTTQQYSATTSDTSTMADSTCTDNPLLQSWASQPLRLPPFQDIQTQHFKPALEEGMRLELEDLQAIVDNPEPPTFENVVAAYDRSGHVLDKVRSVYSNMCSSLNTDELQAVQTEMSPILSRHASKCTTLPGLFEKINAVYQNRKNADLTSEQVRLVERIHLDFTRAGATLNEDDKKELADLKAELASLTTEFQQNVMKDEETYEMVLKKEDMEGCPDGLIQAAR